MVSNVYKTQNQNGLISDHAIANLLVVGFTDQLKGWWDHALTKTQQEEILKAIKKMINEELFWMNKEKKSKMHDFKWYKYVFITRVMQRSGNQQPFWKEKFLAGLPTLLGEKVKNQIRKNCRGIIPYEKLTYGELISFTQKEGLKICQDLKLQKQLKKERYQCRKELGSFCHRFDIRNEPSSSKTCCPVKPKNRRKNISEYYKKPKYRKYRKETTKKGKQNR
uniref:DUF7746 domain-containing protein n=1 Tax=Gossypium raimondii TaxID=29730 RepID=A0A0D2VJG4_GOSRA|nr:hypothetical protein B456_N000300 [Gossypium raimondii]